jgi:LemA protein
MVSILLIVVLMVAVLVLIVIVMGYNKIRAADIRVEKALGGYQVPR